MKLALSFFISLTCVVNLAAQVKMPAPSPLQHLEQEFALGKIHVTYSRPVTKGRKVFGDLVPFNMLWRTGANAATIIRFTDPVEIRGKKIDTGSYALYTIPGYDSWEIILNKGVKNWGVDGYKETEDVFRFKVAPVRISKRVESFTMAFENVERESCELHLTWEKTDVMIPFRVNIKERIRTQLSAAMLTDTKPYWEAAQFYNEYDNNPRKAMENIRKAVELNPNAYWMWLYKANIEKAEGNKKAAMESSVKSMELARAAKNDDYVRMNEALQKRLQ